MAARTPPKTAVRRTDNRRVKQIQGLEYKEIQALKALTHELQTALDSYRNSRSERVDGLVWASVHTGLRKVARALHHTLQERVLQPKRVRRVQLDPQAGRVPKNNIANCPAGTPIVSGRAPANAGTGLPDGFSVTPTYSDENVQGAGERLYKYDARRPVVRSADSGSCEREDPASCERCDI